jgi:predicted Fe-Mo cluster-binding NifX family protein
MIRRVAFASSDGSFIDFHYGRATIFFIYEIGAGRGDKVLRQASRYVEKRHCYRIPGQGEIMRSVAHRREELEKVAELLKDCDAIFVAKIGETPAKFFIERGFRVFQIEARIDRVLEAIVRENELEGNDNGYDESATR